ncbi:acyl-CoA dehydrogenase family protein [Mesorhizobium sp. M0243]|uniref:acyl-CoA dehydrogenase family protein n=1 Tax=Mesorhizobium sp. M0243 TaxID=2956925 RepID=UPI00333BA8F5
MRDFLLNDEMRAFRCEIRALFQRELVPRCSDIERRSGWNAVMEVVQALGRGGYLRLLFRDLYDGPLTEPGLTAATILSEEAAYHNYGFESTVATTLSCAFPLYRFASASIRDRHLRPLIEGKSVGAICMTERNVGSDSAGMETIIRFDHSTSEWVINGFKRYISNASKADVYVVWGISDPTVSPRKGMTAIVVPGDAPGLSFPQNYDFMGRRGCVVGEVSFDEVRVPEDNLLGRENEGFGIMLAAFNFERILLGGSGLGVARSAFDVAVAHAQQRSVFGQKLGQKQLIWDMVAEMSWRLNAAELLTYRASTMYDQGVDGVNLMGEASQAKLVSTEMAIFCADRAVQILGGDGLTQQFGRTEQIYRDARALTIVGGTSEMNKYLISSREMPTIKLNL